MCGKHRGAALARRRRLVVQCGSRRARSASRSKPPKRSRRAQAWIGRSEGGRKRHRPGGIFCGPMDAPRAPRRETRAGSSCDGYLLPSVAVRSCVEPLRFTVKVTLSPGLCPAMIARSFSALATVVPSTATTMSPDFTPAAAAPLPELTSPTVTVPAAVVRMVTPSRACCAFPLAISCETIERTVFDGTAKPTPSLPPESLWICDVTPITLPARSSSGPPELPWLIAASVWIAPSIGVLSGEVISRLSALTMPVVTVPSRPNGLPIATTPSPTERLVESASVSGFSFEAGALTRTTARSVLGSVPTTVPLYVAACVEDEARAERARAAGPAGEGRVRRSLGGVDLDDRRGRVLRDRADGERRRGDVAAGARCGHGDGARVVGVVRQRNRAGACCTS